MSAFWDLWRSVTMTHGEVWLRCFGLLSTLVAIALACSWSNEGCTNNDECCSRSCWRAHEGTNPRCRHSTLGEPCVFDYHCRDDLVCGNNYSCCSPYWKMCIKDEDCCEKDHVCRPAEGFIYDRCLYPASAPPSVRASAWTIFMAGLVGVALMNGWGLGR